MKHNCVAQAASVAMLEFFGKTRHEICSENNMSLATVQRLMLRDDYKEIRSTVNQLLLERFVESRDFVVPEGFGESEDSVDVASSDDEWNFDPWSGIPLD